MSNTLSLWQIQSSPKLWDLRNCHITCHLSCPKCQLSNNYNSVGIGWFWKTRQWCENRFFGLSLRGHYKIQDSLPHLPHASTAKMQFSSSLFSSTILVLGYLTNAALCVPTDDSSKLVVNYNQQSFHSTGICTSLLSPTATFNGLTICSTSHTHCYTSLKFDHTMVTRRIGS